MESGKRRNKEERKWKCRKKTRRKASESREK